MLVSICTACLEYSLESSINFEKGELLKETMNRRRKRDREPSRIPLKRILKVLNKKKNIEKRYSQLRKGTKFKVWYRKVDLFVPTCKYDFN